MIWVNIIVGLEMYSVDKVALCWLVSLLVIPIMISIPAACLSKKNEMFKRKWKFNIYFNIYFNILLHWIMYKQSEQLLHTHSMALDALQRAERNSWKLNFLTKWPLAIVWSKYRSNTSLDWLHNCCWISGSITWHWSVPFYDWWTSINHSGIHLGKSQSPCSSDTGIFHSIIPVSHNNSWKHCWDV